MMGVPLLPQQSEVEISVCMGYIVVFMLLLPTILHICVPAETFFLFSRCQVLIVVLSQDTLLCECVCVCALFELFLALRPLVCDNLDLLAIGKKQTMCKVCERDGISPTSTLCQIRTSSSRSFIQYLGLRHCLI